MRVFTPELMRAWASCLPLAKSFAKMLLVPSCEMSTKAGALPKSLDAREFSGLLGSALTGIAIMVDVFLCKGCWGGALLGCRACCPSVCAAGGGAGVGSGGALCLFAGDQFA